MRRVAAFIVLVTLLAGLVLPTSLAAPAAPPIRLQAGTFRPGLGEKPDIPPGLMVAEPASTA